MKSITKTWISELRLRQWTKNLLVFAITLFNGTLFHADEVIHVAIMAASFCLASSAVYLFNDIFDAPRDRANPAKCHRPIASRQISPAAAWCALVLLMAVSIAITLLLPRMCLATIAAYMVINFLYTVRLKNVVILDVMIISFGFVARAMAGAYASLVSTTNWFVLCVMFLSLFLALGKRRGELSQITGIEAGETRRVLRDYSVEFADRLMDIVSAALIMCYSLFTAETKTFGRASMMLTVPLVVYGIFYYVWFVQVKNGGGEPDEALYKEKPVLAVVLLYVAAVVVIRTR